MKELGIAAFRRVGPSNLSENKRKKIPRETRVARPEALERLSYRVIYAAETIDRDSNNIYILQINSKVKDSRLLSYLKPEYAKSVGKFKWPQSEA